MADLTNGQLFHHMRVCACVYVWYVWCVCVDMYVCEGTCVHGHAHMGVCVTVCVCVCVCVYVWCVCA